MVYSSSRMRYPMKRVDFDPNGERNPVNRCVSGYTEGGLSCDVRGGGQIINLYQRMPQLPTINTIGQRIPKQQLPEAILEGRAESSMCDPTSIEAQFAKVGYPVQGYSPVRMRYRYCDAFIGTMSETNRWVKAYRSANLEFVVNQRIWN